MTLGLDVRQGRGELFEFEHEKKWHSQFAMEKKKNGGKTPGRGIGTGTIKIS